MFNEGWRSVKCMSPLFLPVLQRHAVLHQTARTSAEYATRLLKYG